MYAKIILAFVRFLPVQNDDEDFNYVIAFFLGTAACLYQVSDRLR